MYYNTSEAVITPDQSYFLVRGCFNLIYGVFACDVIVHLEQVRFA